MLNYKYDLIPSELDFRDFKIESIYDVEISLPKKFDYIDQMRPIRDQGEQGSCSAMSAAAIKEWQEYKDIGFKEYMSPQFVYNLRSTRGEGMTPRNTMQILNKRGIVPESLYPYGTTSKIDNNLLKKALNFTIKGYAQVSSVYGAKSAIIADGPLYIGLPVYNADKPKFWLQDNPRQAMLGGHAVVIVGWNEDSFIIRNSWGKNWGYNGFCYYPFKEWGSHWEVWTTIDADSCIDKLKCKVEDLKPKRPKFFKFW